MSRILGFVTQKMCFHTQQPKNKIDVWFVCEMYTINALESED